jgi:hypothetical protein
VANGRVEDGGTYDETVSKGLTSALHLDTDSSTQPDDETKPPSAKESTARVAENNQRVDLARAAGDLTLYRYYFRSVGLLPSIVLVGFVIINVFCNSFGRK